MLRIGITGGIGSGKSVVCEYFQKLQVPVYNADKEASRLIDKNLEIRKKIISFFGEKAYSKKSLNKPFIRKAVFNNQEALQKLNSITHPELLKNFDSWCFKLKTLRHPYIIKEAALMFESESYKSLDFIVCVVSPLETRIARVIKRDKKNREEIEQIIVKQMTDEEKILRSEFVIHNLDNELLLPKIVALHAIILKKSITNGK